MLSSKREACQAFAKKTQAAPCAPRDCPLPLYLILAKCQPSASVPMPLPEEGLFVDGPCPV